MRDGRSVEMGSWRIDGMVTGVGRKVDLAQEGVEISSGGACQISRPLSGPDPPSWELHHSGFQGLPRGRAGLKPI